MVYHKHYFENIVFYKNIPICIPSASPLHNKVQQKNGAGQTSGSSDPWVNPSKKVNKSQRLLKVVTFSLETFIWP